MNKAAGWIAGLVVLLALSALALRYYVPPLPGALDLQIAFAATPGTQSEPLAVAGRPGDGDFVYVKYLDARRVAFGYDRWGTGGPVSAPVQIEPGVRYALRIESPSLARVRGSAVSGPDRLRVTFNGAPVLESAVPFQLRKASRAWFAENPLGGSSCGPHFSGELLRADGRPLRGRVRDVFSADDRLAAWLRFGCWQVIGILLASAACGWAVARLARTDLAALKKYLAEHRAGPHRWFITAAGGCVIAFSWLITEGTGRFVHPEVFGDFYDYQAASLLHGRLDVPKDAISGEAFVVEGKYYGYFGLTPALLRLPFVIYDLAWGCLSRSLMLACYVACLAAAYALLRRATRLVRGDPNAAPSAIATVLFTLSVGLGSTFFFLGSRAYIYHEAILCGAAFALWSAWCALRWLERPDSPAWLGALACGALAAHARPTVGLFALTLLGCVAIAVAGRGLLAGSGRKPLLAALLAAVAMLSFSAVSYLKFKTFDGSPFKYSIQYDATRLARFEGKNFHLANIPFNADTYFLRANVEWRRNFPWLEIVRPRREDYPRAKMDHIEHTLGVPLAMPALFALATAGSLLAALRAPVLRRDFAVLWLAVLPMAVAMLAIVVVSHRYSTDFCPFLVAAAACGLASLETLPAGWRAAARSSLAALALAAALVTGLIALWYQGELVWGVPDDVKQNYHALGRRIDAFFGVAPQ